MHNPSSISLEKSQWISGQLKNLCDESSAVRRQFVFSNKELTNESPVLLDPIGDEIYSPVRGIIHRYPDRVLLLPNYSCPSICRFCFRKTKIGKEASLTEAELETALNYIRDHSEIFEVILSGGEPLLSFQGLQRLISRLETIDHVEVIRIHTRLPLTSPADAAHFFEENQLTYTKPLYMVIHCNHVDEITPQWKRFAQQAHHRGIILLSQTVLLSGINDSVNDLETLFRELLRNRVRPYYLHHPDHVIGTDHFRVSLQKGRALFSQLRGRLSGSAIPRYILDIPGGHGKISAEPESLTEDHQQFRITAGTTCHTLGSDIKISAR